MPGEESPSISVIAIGPVLADATAELVRRFSTIEQIDLDLPRDAALAATAAELNRAMDGAACDWLLILRSHERVVHELADEIGACIGPNPRAWAYRIRSETIYCGSPLALGDAGEGEIRLLHRRHARFNREAPGGMKAQGTVIRINQPLVSVTFSSVEEHSAWLAERGRQRSTSARIARFLGSAFASGILRIRTNEARYLWTDAGWERGAGQASDQTRASR